MLAGQPRARVAQAGQLLVHRGDRPRRHQHRGGVEHVLARGAVVDPVGGLAGPLSQLGDERDDRVAAPRAARPSSSGSRRAAQASGDRFGGPGRHDVEALLDAGERRLDVEHRPDPGRRRRSTRGSRPS